MVVSQCCPQGRQDPIGLRSNSCTCIDLEMHRNLGLVVSLFFLSTRASECGFCHSWCNGVLREQRCRQLDGSARTNPLWPIVCCPGRSSQGQQHVEPSSSRRAFGEGVLCLQGVFCAIFLSNTCVSLLSVFVAARPSLLQENQFAIPSSGISVFVAARWSLLHEQLCTNSFGTRAVVGV